MQNSQWPVSPIQNSFWHTVQNNHSNLSYGFVSATFKVQIDVNRASEFLERLQKEVEIFRASYTQDNYGALWSNTCDQANIEIKQFDWQNLEEKEIASEKEQLIKGLADKTAEQPWMQLCVAKLKDQSDWVSLALPAINSDKFTLLRVLNLVYLASINGVENTADNYLNEVVQYADLASWLNEFLMDDDLYQARVYWQTESSEEVFSDRIGLQNYLQKNESEQLAYAELSLGDYWENLEKESKNLGVSENLLLSAACRMELAKITDTAILATERDSRSDEALETVLGPLTRALPICPEITQQLSKSVLLEADAFEQASDYLECYIKPATCENSSFPFVFSSLQVPEEIAVNAELEFIHCQTENSKIEFTLLESGANSKLQICYQPDFIDEKAINIFLDNLVNRLTAKPDTQALSLTSDFQVSGTQINCEWPNIIDWFNQSVVNGLGCIIKDDESVSITQLNEKVNRLAHYFIEHNISKGSRVGICLPRSVDFLVSMLAIVKVGGVYIPIDDELPVGRIDTMLKDANASLVICSAQMDPLAVDSLNIETINLDDYPSVDLAISIQADDPAYILYTSGSTGKPKGVCISHGALLNHMMWMENEFNYVNSDVFLQRTSVSFDASVWELWSPLLAGATMVIADKAINYDMALMQKTLSQHQINVMQLVPSLLSVLLEQWQAESVSHLRLLFCGGEMLKTDLARNAVAQLNCEVINLYGPSETCIDATFFRFDPLLTTTSVPIGKPIANTSIRLLKSGNDFGHQGESGELCISGNGVFSGYLNQADLTRQSMFHCQKTGMDFYKTGDRVTLLNDGNLYFNERLDDQVKLNGFRIEPGEIALFVEQNELATQAVCLVEKQKLSLVLFVRSEKTEEVLLDELTKNFPAYMIPTSVIHLQDFPTLFSGKIDNRLLLKQFNEMSHSVYQAPVGNIEIKLAEIWQKAMEFTDSISRDSDFFKIGGHSLLAMKVVNQVSEAFNINLNFRHLFENSTLMSLAAYIESHQQSYNRYIEKADSSEPLKLSFAQQRLLFIDRFEGGVEHYNMPVALNVVGDFNADIAERALTNIINRHQVFRTQFATSADGDVQIIQSDFNFTLQRIDLSHLSGSSQQEALDSAIDTNVNYIFDLSADLLLKATIIYLGEKSDQKNYLLLMNSHHIATDGWSMSILVEEFSQYYQAILTNTPSDLPELRLQYADFAQWQHSQLEQGLLSEQLSYWQEQLADLPVVHNIPLTFARPKQQTFNGSSYQFSCDKKQLEALKAMASEQNVTLFMLLHGCFSLLLSRYSGSSDIVIGTPVANRTISDVESLIGLFVNLLVLRVDCDKNLSFNDFLHQVKDVNLNALDNQDIPFELLVDSLNPERSTSFSPLFQVMFSMDTNKSVDLTLPGIDITSMTSDHVFAKFELTLEAIENESGLNFNFIYNSDLFDQSSVESMGEHLQCLITAIIAQPQACLSAMPMLTPQEHDFLLNDFNDTQLDYPKDKCIHQLFEAQALQTPDNVALVYEDEQLTYAQLNGQANQLAHYLVEQGVTANSYVALCLERSSEMMVSLLAILKVGAAYVPLDPSYPVNRLEHVLADSGAAFLITDEQILPILTVSEQTRVICQNESLTEKLNHHNTDNLSAAGLTIESKAYLIYTSGSTGNPKGVMITHNNVLNLFAGLDQELGRDAEQTWLAVTSISFDISVLELFWPLSHGCKIVLLPDRPLPVKPGKAMDFSLFYFAAHEAGSSDSGNKYQLLLEGAKFADQNGLNAVWVPERHFNSFGDKFPNPSVAAGAISVLTEKVKIRAGSVVLPLHDPIRVAEEWSMVDHLSNGRVEIAIASGWHPDDFVLAETDYQQRYHKMREKIDQLKSFWRGDGLKRRNGLGQEVEVFLHPHPQQAELPIWVTAANSPETFRYAGSIGANVLTHLLGQTTEQLEEKIKIYREALVASGYSAEQGKVALMLHTYLSDNATNIKEIVETPFKNYLRQSLNLLKPFADENNMDFQEHTEEILELAFRRYYQTSGLFGTPESCFHQINEFKAAGVDEIACLIDFGIDFETNMAGLPSLARLQKLCFQQASQDQLLSRRLERTVTPQELIIQHKVSHMQCTPAYVTGWSDHEAGCEALNQLKQLLVGGEALPEALAGQLAKHTGGKVYNMYGPTETTVWSAIKEISSHEVGIGGPIANTQFYVLNESMKLVPKGHPGELYIAGEGVSPGYFELDALTEERFIADPFSKNKGSRLYKTGDLVRIKEKGEIEFIGRLDDQVKINGFRIELGEIQSILRTHESVREAVVVTYGQPAQLIAYFVPSQAGVSKSELKQLLKSKVPAHMIPAAFVELEAWPMTPNNKIDRNRLPAPDKNDLRKAQYVAPRFKIEHDLVAIWKGIFDIEQIGIQDDFFELGGSSLLLNQLVINVNQHFGISMPLKVAFNNTTIADFSVDLANLVNMKNEQDTEEQEFEEELL
ncbi:MAG: amino acid adenylation domain-containing protein [Alteromonadaceae bacterium]|nr:amino acid adenylation domain-containing protein [Alteromonadaceae bacterium]